MTVVALACALTLGACSDDDDGAPASSGETAASAEPSPSRDPTCPLTGSDPPSPEVAERPAVAVKIENNPVAYPLAGLEKAELVYEELVEGGQTRFMAIYHCTDARKAGPVRSTRIVDPAIMLPVTRILAGAGGNAIVRKALRKAGIVLLHEKNSGKAMRRLPGLAHEHSLYANTAKLRERAMKRFDEPPPEDLFRFGQLEGRPKTKPAKRITIEFSDYVTVEYEWTGRKWLRIDRGSPLQAESGGAIKVDNVIIEQHTVENSKRLFDVLGNPSPEILDDTGSGRAVLFRDGRAIRGRWVRKTTKDRVVYKTKAGAEMTLRPGTTWVELVPDNKGELKGSFTFTKKKS